MTTDIRDPATDFEFGELSDLFARQPTEDALFVATDEHLIAPLDGERSSTEASAALSTTFRRIVRTTAPFFITDALCLVWSGVTAQVLLKLIDPNAALNGGMIAAGLMPLPLVLVYWLSDLYSEIWAHPVIEFRQLTRVTSFGLLAAAMGGLLAWPLPIWCAVSWLFAIILVPMMRTVARHLCVKHTWWGYPTLIIGSGDRAEGIARLLLECPRSGLRPVLLTDPKGNCRGSAMRVMNDHATLESILRTEGIRHAVVSLPEFSIARLAKILDRYSNLVPHLLVFSDASTLPTLWGASRSFGRLSGIEVRNGLLLATLQTVKRFLDLLVAISSLAVSLPLLLVIAVTIKLSSHGPILYGHTRIGRHGRQFKAWKFRTMHVDGDKILREHLEQNPDARAEWERDHKLRNDPRVTWSGRILRKLSLDELPQIWNVLRGDMSIVGPRPIVTAEIERYGEVFRQYASVKPGITGLWQVSGRSNLSYQDRVLLDQFYIRHWSPWLDIYILAKTVVALMNRDGAY